MQFQLTKQNIESKRQSSGAPQEILSEVEIGCDRFQYSTCDDQIESPKKSKNHANTWYDEGMDLRLYPWRVPLHLTIDEGHVP